MKKDIKCPYCGKNQTENPVKSWEYGNYLKKKIKEKIKSVKCSRYECNCGKRFNFYKSTKTTWTIPKIIKNLHV